MRPTARRTTAVAVVTGVLLSLVAALAPSASAAPSLRIVSSSQHGPDSSGYVHIVGEVENLSATAAESVQIDAQLLAADGSFLDFEVASSRLTVLRGGAKSPFDVLFQPPAGYDHYTLTVRGDDALRSPNNNFTTVVDSEFTDGAGRHIVGRVTNNNTTPAEFIAVNYTFYDAAGTVVGVAVGFVSSGDPVAPGATGPFEVILDPWIPAYTSKAFVTESSTAAAPPGGEPAAKVTIGVDVQRITSGNAPVLSGFVTDAAGVFLSGKTVSLIGQTYGQTSYQPVTTANGAAIVTDVNGRWTAPIRPERQTAFVAVVDQARSQPLVVFVSARVNLDRSVANRTVPRSYAFRGDLDPNAPDFRGAAVGLALNGRDSRGRPTFSVIGTARSAVDATASYAVSAARGLPAGQNVFVVFTSARNGLLKGSASVRVNVS